MKKRVLGILFGGVSVEHDVSIRSTKRVIGALASSNFTIFPIGVDRQGRWHDCRESFEMKEGEGLPFLEACTHFLSKVDVVFPFIHGTFGEDGCLQGVLEMANIPYVGASVLGSAVGMDKDVQKRLLRDAGIPIVPFRVFTVIPDYDDVVKDLGLPLFIKPANMGSSVGIVKASNYEEFTEGVRQAFFYDAKIIIESAIVGRELECAILGNVDPVSTVPGEIIPRSGIYDYEAKFVNPDAVEYVLPAPLSLAKENELRKMALDTYRVLCCEGLARVDFFLDRDERLYVNEINTLPGFTKASFYPWLWEISGVPLPVLVERLIDLAFKKFEKKQKLERQIKITENV